MWFETLSKHPAALFEIVALAIKELKAEDITRISDTHIEYTEKWEKVFEKVIKKMFRAQCKEIVGGMEKTVKATSRELWHLDKDKWNKEFEEESKTVFKKVVAGAGKNAMEAVGVGLTFDQTYPEVEEWIDNNAIRLSFDVNDETESMLRNAFKAGFVAGESMAALADRVRDVFTDMEKWRALRIARTETIKASNYGAIQGYMQSGVVEAKYWLVAKDDRLCPYCGRMGTVFNDKHPISVDGLFMKKGDTIEITDAEGKKSVMHLDYEDVHAPPLHPNCRCTIIPVVKKLD